MNIFVTNTLQNLTWSSKASKLVTSMLVHHNVFINKPYSEIYREDIARWRQ